VSNQSWWEKVNTFYKEAYNHFADAVSQGTKWIREVTADSIDWIWGTLQGGWNQNMRADQIVADAMLSFVPILGVVIDIRDLLACIYSLNQQSKNSEEQTYKWIELALTLIGCVPVGGDLAKPVMKIVLKQIRRFGLNNLPQAVKSSIEPIRQLINNEKFVKVVGRKNIDTICKGVADFCRQQAAELKLDPILKKWRELNKDLADLLDSYGYLMPDEIKRKLVGLLNSSQNWLNIAPNHLVPAFADTGRILNHVADGFHGPSKMQVAKVNQKTPVQLGKNKPLTVVRRADKRKIGCFKPGKKKIEQAKRKGDQEYQKFEKEYYRQLKDQEKGLNGLTIDEYLAGREAYKNNGRGAGVSQADTRNSYQNKISTSLSESYQKQGKSPKEADTLANERTKAIMKELDALHNPDMIAGGKDVTGRLGRGDVNRSIGGNWNQKAPDSREAGDYRTRLKQLDDYANEMKKKYGGDANMNAEFNRCPT
jgi:hypothetical protein